MGEVYSHPETLKPGKMCPMPGGSPLPEPQAHERQTLARLVSSGEGGYFMTMPY